MDAYDGWEDDYQKGFDYEITTEEHNDWCDESGNPDLKWEDD
jgi:hypothetical protein